MMRRSIGFWGVSLVLISGVNVAATPKVAKLPENQAATTVATKKMPVKKVALKPVPKKKTAERVTKTTSGTTPIPDPINVVPDTIQAMPDPYQRFNHHAYALNRGLDTAIIKPVTTVYHDVIPWPVRTGVNNFFNNLLEVPGFFNHLLQFQFKSANATAARFVINITLGVGGVVDVATKAKMPDYQTDFGITLAHYGARESPYLVLPLLGPSTVRDMLSWPIDYYAFSVNARAGDLQTKMFWLRTVDNRNTLLRVEEVAQEVALDRYNFERDAYLQFRNNIINGTKLQVATVNETSANVPSDDPNAAPLHTDAKTTTSTQNKKDELYVLD